MVDFEDIEPTSHAALPTNAEPGSPEKVAVLELRVRLGLKLWHPLDNHLSRLQHKVTPHRYKADYVRVRVLADEALQQRLG